jgi:hypothetical protein
MTIPSTRNPFIITTVLVGIMTYVIVFNMMNISGILGQRYNEHRKRLLDQMQIDPSKIWNTRRKRFEEFTPNIERKTSEWWVIAYGIREMFKKKQRIINPAEV